MDFRPARIEAADRQIVDAHRPDPALGQVAGGVLGNVDEVLDELFAAPAAFGVAGAKQNALPLDDPVPA